MKAETRQERALFAARLHLRQGTMLSAEAGTDIAQELLATREEADLLAEDNEALRDERVGLMARLAALTSEERVLTAKVPA